MTNEKLKEIKERLLAENDKRRRVEQEQVDACARYYERGVNDALAAVSFVRPEQPTKEDTECANRPKNAAAVLPNTTARALPKHAEER